MIFGAVVFLSLLCAFIVGGMIMVIVDDPELPGAYHSFIIGAFGLIIFLAVMLFIVVITAIRGGYGL